MPPETPAPTGAAPREKPQHERKAELRKLNNNIASRVKYAYGGEMSVVNGTLNKMIGVNNIRQASEEDLQKRLRLAQHWLETGAPPQVV